MRVCHCTLPIFNPGACRNCPNNQEYSIPDHTDINVDKMLEIYKAHRLATGTGSTNPDQSNQECQYDYE